MSSERQEASNLEVSLDEQGLQEIYPEYRGVDDDYKHAGQDALERLWDMKFGIRIHWSVYSIPGNGAESWTLHESRSSGTPTFRAQYEELYKGWNPCLFNADEWTDMMRDAGMKFFVFTTKHHDGFSMYDTKTRVKRRMKHLGEDAGKIIDCDLAYSIMETPFKRDIVKELVNAGRKRDLGIGLYYSHIDWFDSDFRIDCWNYQKDTAPNPLTNQLALSDSEKYTRENDPEGYNRMIHRHREQIRELLTNYGNVDLLSFDMCFPENGRTHGIGDEVVETTKMARRIQPEVLMRKRGIAPYGDYKTPERCVPEEDNLKERSLPWMVIYPGSEHFSHVWNDNYKPTEWIIENLIDITAKGGCFQVGYGPGPDGSFNPTIKERLTEVGEWLSVNGEGIYATRPYKNFCEAKDIHYTRSKDNKFVYAIFTNWPESSFSSGKVVLKKVDTPDEGLATILGAEDRPFKFKRTSNGVEIEIPEWFSDHDKRPCKYAWTLKMPQGSK